MSYNRKTLGVVISRLRTERGLSQEKFSGLVGISRSHLTMIENGKKTVRLDTLWRLADALEIKPSQLVAMIESANNN